MKLDTPYKREELLSFLDEFIPSFEKDVRGVDSSTLKTISEAHLLGRSKKLDLHVFELHHDGNLDKRVALTNDAFRIMKNSLIHLALAVFRSKDSDQWRLSLMTATPQIKEGGKVVTEWSNPRRFSFLVGPDTKINTPYNFLVKKGPVKDFNDLKSRFAIEVVNEEFYRQIADLYIKLVGGKKGKGKKKTEHTGMLSLPSVTKGSQEMQEFAVRLIGRLVFCWFLKEKKGDEEIPLVPEELLSAEAVKSIDDYYHSTLEPLFFEILNTPIHSRKEKYQYEPYAKIPYLNGGLFAPHKSDFYTSDEERQSVNNNTVQVPDEWLEDLVAILNRYNFTIDENTSVDIELSVDPEMLGRIFENLLAEINPETGESARKSTGSFYTPREIVEYMVDKSLIEYLLTKTKIDNEKLEALVSYDELDDLDHPLSKTEKSKVVTALGELKALDPACGSGAFPMSLLQKIVLMLQRIDPDAKLWFEQKIEGISDIALKKAIKKRFGSENLDYIRKLGVIRDSIFGVDIQSVATEIARLRCFLTLIVEEDVSDNQPNRGVEPLPNLDFKFVTANSLVPLPGKGAKQDSMFDDKEGVEKLKELRDRYFTASNSERDQLKLEFSMAQNEMLEHMISVRSSTDRTTALSTWKPFSDKVTSWFDPEWMFGEESFDVVIGNPPYISTEKINEPKKSTYREIYSDVHKSRTDIYAYFYQRGLELTKESEGLLCYITSNKWMRTDYGEALRAYFTKKNPLKLLDFGGFKVFDSATVDTNILLIQNQDNKNNLQAVHFEDDYQRGESIVEYVAENQVPIKNLSSDTWFIASPKVTALKEKIEKNGKPLGDWGVSIKFGVKTGCNDVFLIDGQKFSDFVSKDQRSEKIIKQAIHGSDIEKYNFSSSDLYVIAAKYGSYKNFEDKYPAVYQYMKNHEDRLKNRAQVKNTRSGKNKFKDYPGQHHWLELDNNPQDDFLNMFDNEKIVWREITSSQSFAIAPPGPLVIAPATFLTTDEMDLKFLLGILNSKLILWFFNHLAHNLGSSGLEWKKSKIKKLPIPEKKNDSVKQSIVSNVDKIVNKKQHGEDSSDLEEQTDELVMDLYELTDEEKEIIRNSL